VLIEAMDRGFVRTFIDAGCMVLNPGCGSCREAHMAMLESGEKALSTASWNCPGINGATDCEVMLASPATVAASALDGEITDPRKYLK
jgi:homoaconitase/3-isopropylmalate dehydratase large subunit